jgi:hypothetical protein
MARVAWSCLYFHDVWAGITFQGKSMLHWCTREVEWSTRWLLKTYVPKSGKRDGSWHSGDKYVIMLGTVQKDWGGPHPGDFDCYKRAGAPEHCSLCFVCHQTVRSVFRCITLALPQERRPSCDSLQRVSLQLRALRARAAACCTSVQTSSRVPQERPCCAEDMLGAPSCLRAAHTMLHENPLSVDCRTDCCAMQRTFPRRRTVYNPSARRSSAAPTRPRPTRPPRRPPRSRSPRRSSRPTPPTSRATRSQPRTRCTNSQQRTPSPRCSASGSSTTPTPPPSRPRTGCGRARRSRGCTARAAAAGVGRCATRSTRRWRSRTPRRTTARARCARAAAGFVLWLRARRSPADARPCVRVCKRPRTRAAVQDVHCASPLRARAGASEGEVPDQLLGQLDLRLGDFARHALKRQEQPVPRG